MVAASPPSRRTRRWLLCSWMPLTLFAVSIFVAVSVLLADYQNLAARAVQVNIISHETAQLLALTTITKDAPLETGSLEMTSKNKTGSTTYKKKRGSIPQLDRNLCRVEEFFAPTAEPSSRGGGDEESFALLPPDPPLDTRFGVHYQCKGPLYKQFGKKLAQLVREDQSNKPKHWGRRERPLPANSTILLLGNSHLRQVAVALLCQHQHQLTSIEDCPGNKWHDKGTCKIVHLGNFQSTIYFVTNTPYVFSQKWRFVLENILFGGVPLNSFDAIVLGRHNNYSPAMYGSFFEQMMNFTVREPLIDFIHHPGPSVVDMREAYTAGPLIVQSMFCANRNRVLQRDIDRVLRRDMERVRQQPLVYVDARRYVEKLGECAGTMHYSGKSDCNETRVSDHRCTGPMGGHPDLVAWDLVEVLHDTLKARQI